MNDPRPGFMFNVVEFWSSAKVSAMDAEAVGVYLFLLSRQWQNGSIPGNVLLVRAMCRAVGFRHWEKLWELLEPCFPLCDDGLRRNRRLEIERELADIHSLKQSGRAKARWERWKAEKPMPRQYHGNAVAMPENAGAMPSDRTETGHSVSTRLAVPADKPRAPTKKVGEHVQIVETFQRAHAEFRHDIELTRDTPIADIPIAVRYIPPAKDWVAAAAMWKAIHGDMSLVRSRMKNLFESTADWTQHPSVALMWSHWSDLETPILAFTNFNGKAVQHGS